MSALSLREILPNSTIVTLSEADLPSILAIEHQCYDFPWSGGVFVDCLSGAYLCRGLYDADVLVAYAVLSIAVGECHILNICVSPKYQGSGVASAFLSRLLVEAHEWEADIVFLEVRASNIAALGLYSKLGFSEIGRRKDYYPNGDSREDAMVLSLPISPSLSAPS
ncbi:ribosomal-protein-alanine N-acetyltransferase [Gammaproteobacteria bacterium 45_16_T64]|nr:ribosomal-protein-alanine N-acetyltransferase [Gammaproteobacteria bacterium 45_16_T64]